MANYVYIYLQIIVKKIQKLFDIFVTFVREFKKGVVTMDDNKKIASMLIKFAHAFLAIGALLIVAFTLLVGWHIEHIGLLTGIGFVFGSGVLYIISIVSNAVFAFEENLKAVHNKLNDNKARPLWK